MDNKNIGEKIRVLRKSRNITINDLGRLVGMSKSTISMWETGQRRPEYEELDDNSKMLVINQGIIDVND